MSASRCFLRQPLLPLFVALFAAFCCLFCASPAQAEEPRWGRLYILSGIVSVRENPSDTALKVRVFKAGQKVRIDFQDDGWAAAFDPKEPARSELKALGYVRLDELKAHGSPDPSQPLPPENGKNRAEAQAEAGSAKADKTTAKAAAKPAEKMVEKSGGQPAAPVKAATAKAAPAHQPEPKDEKTLGKAHDKSAAKPEGKGQKSFGEIRVADRNLAVRGARTAESEFRRLLRAGQRVRVDFAEEGWFAVFDPDEKTRDLARAWGYSRDKYLVAEDAYAGPPADASAVAKDAEASAGAAKGQKSKAAEDAAVGYSVVERKTEGRKPKVTTLRVRLDLAKPPAAEAMRKIAREIWKTERKKDEDLQLEMLLSGMDAQGLAYATARFHDDGRLREFWWRDVVLGKPKK